MSELKYDKKYKVERLTDDSGFRPALEDPYYVDGILKATNGRALVHVKATGDLPEGPIPKELFIRARKHVHFPTTTVTLNQNDNKMIRFAAERMWFERSGAGSMGKYPNTEQVIPRTSLGPTKLAINPSLLLKLAEAMGSPNSIVLHVPNNSNNPSTLGDGVVDAIYVEVLGDPDVEGVIMPMRLETGQLRQHTPAKPIEAPPRFPVPEEPKKETVDIEI